MKVYSVAILAQEQVRSRLKNKLEVVHSALSCCYSLMEPDEFRKLVNSLGRASAILSRPELTKLAAVAEALYEGLLTKWRKLLETYPEDIAMSIYLADGWSASVRSTETAQIGTHLVLRRGRLKHEFLLQRRMLKVMLPDETVKKVMLVHEPVGLRNGRSSWHIFSSLCESGPPTLRRAGHRGFCLNVYIADGAVKSALEKRVRALHELYYEVAELGDDAFVLKMTDLVLVIKCLSHGCSNAIIWGLQGPRSLIDSDDPIIILKSLRKAASAINDQISTHVTQTMTFSDVRSGSQEDRERFWRSMDVEEVIIEEIVFVDPVWDGHRLTVNSELRDDPSAERRVRAIVLYLCRFFYISETRWGKSGKSSRLFIRALCVGLDNIVDLCRASDCISMENLNGFYRATPPVRTYYIIAATSTRPAESLVLEFLEDDRFLKRAHELKQLIDEEFDYVMSLPDYCWQRLAAIAFSHDITMDSIRSLAFSCMSVSMGYLHWDVFEPLQHYPLRLTQGDIIANVDALAALEVSDPSLDDFTLKLKLMVDLGLPRGTYYSLIKFMRDEIPFSTDLIEKAHASGAILKRSHDGISELQLRDRVFVNQCLPLLGASRYAQIEAKLSATIDKLIVKKRALTAQNIFHKRPITREAVLACAQEDGLEGTFDQVKQRVMNNLFSRLPVQQRNALQREADIATVSRDRELLAERSHHVERLNLHRDRWVLELAQDGFTDTVRAYALTEEEVQGLSIIFERIMAQPSLRYLSNRTLTAPRAPLLKEQVEFIRVEKTLLFLGRSESPWWVKHVCANREHFRDAAIATLDNPDTLYYATMMRQSPYTAVFMELKRRPRALPASLTVAGPIVLEELRPDSHRQFTHEPLKLMLGSEVPIDPDAELLVFRGLRFTDGCVCTTYTQMAFEDFAIHHLPPSAPTVSRAPSSGTYIPKAIREAMIAKYPFLSDDDFDAAFRPTFASSRLKSGTYGPKLRDIEKELFEEGDGVDNGPPDPELDNDVPELEPVDGDDVDAELARLREDVAEEAHVDMYFYARVRGGRWTAANRGVAADAIAGYARGGVARAFCEIFAFSKEMSFYFGRYGEEGSRLLANEFCRRGDYFCDLWVSSSNDEFVFTQQMLDDYQDGFEFIAWLCDQPIDSVCFEKGNELRRLAPKLG